MMKTTSPRNVLFAALGATALLAAPAMAAPKDYKLPKPDGKPADMSKKVKVFIIMGQSNTLEFGKADMIKDDPMYSFAVNDDGSFTERKDVRSVHVMGSGGFNPDKIGARRNHWLTIPGKKFGMEQGIGHQLGHALDEPVLILKSAIGNRGLGWDLLPPGSPSWEVEETNKKTGETKTMVYAGYGQSPAKWEKGTEPEPIGWKAGLQYDGDIGRANAVLADLKTYYPDATGYEVAGFFWWQGCKDRGNPAYFNRYEKHLGFLADALRKEFNAPNAKFVGASLGEDEEGVENGGGAILEALKAHAAKDEKNGWVYTFPLKGGPGSSCGHYSGNGKTYMNVGLAMGAEMVELLKK